MRAVAMGVLGVAVAILLAWIAWSSLVSEAPVEAGAAAPAVRGMAADPVNAAPEPLLQREAPAPLPSNEAPLELHWVEAESRAPLPRLGVKLWSWKAGGSGGPTDLPVDAQGRAAIARSLLIESAGIQFEVVLPEFADAIVQRPEPSIEALRTRREPLVLAVFRGRAREVRVVDGFGAAIEGAWLEAEHLCRVVTGVRGSARPVLTVPPPSSVRVAAAGHREVHVEVPPEGAPWLVELPLANRLELEVAAGVDLLAHHAVVRLPRAFTQRTFHQSHYVQTPGRAVDGTAGHWDQAQDRSSTWQLGFPASRVAVVDQLYDSGPIEVELWRYDQMLDRRAVELPVGGGRTRVVLRATLPPADAELLVVDDAGQPIAGARVRLGAEPGAVLGPSLDHGLPIWAPDLRTDAFGHCRAPVPTSAGTRIVVAAEGRALAVRTWREVATAGHRIALPPGCTVALEYVDRDGKEMAENACGAPAHVAPRVKLSHDLWLGPVSAHSYSACTFAGLPAAEVEVHFSHLDEVLRHDACVPRVRFASRRSVDELDLGK